MLNRSSTGAVTYKFELAAQYVYSAYGEFVCTNLNGHTVGSINPILYKGYVYDRETGLYYLQSRYYSPYLCKFISMDEPQIILSNGGFIKSTDLYEYCNNNPVMLLDNDGYSAAAAVAATALSLLKPLIYGVLIYTCAVILSDPKFWEATGQLINSLGTSILSSLVSLIKSIKTSYSKAKLKAKNKKYENHHIVAKAHKRAEVARKILGKAGIGINSSQNLVSIKYNLHRHLHRNTYYDSVTSLMKKTNGVYKKVVITLASIKTVLKCFSIVTP